MVSFFVVFEHPCPGDFSHFIEVTEQPSIEYLVTIRAIEAFDKRILIRLPRLNIVEHNPVVLAPTDNDFAQESGSIVGSQNIRQTALLFQLFEYPNQPSAWKRRINLDRKRFTIEVIKDIERSKTHAVVQGITHEVC